MRKIFIQIIFATIGLNVSGQKVGINTTTPQQTMDVGGKIYIGEDDAKPTEGTIRYNAASNDIEGYNGTQWLSFTKKSQVGKWGDKDVKEKYSFTAPDIGLSNEFGWSVAIDSCYAVIGAPTAGSPSIGKVYIYKKENNTWSIDTTLLSGSPNFGYFGQSVAIKEGVIAVGSPYEDAVINNVNIASVGKVYLFTQSNGIWSLFNTIVPYDGNFGDAFGASLAISENYVFIGAPNKDTIGYSDIGKVYEYNTAGSLFQEFTAYDRNTYDQFGKSLSTSGRNLIVGSFFKNTGTASPQGKAYIYFRGNGSGWKLQAELLPSPFTGIYQGFGSAVDIDGDRAVVGSHFEDNNKGRVDVFKRCGTMWQLEQSITNPTAVAGDEFGKTVSIYKENIAISAPGMDASYQGQGKALIYSFMNNSWQLTSTLTNSDGQTNGAFAGNNTNNYESKTLDIYKNEIIIGFPSYNHVVNPNPIQYNQGKIYFFNK